MRRTARALLTITALVAAPSALVVAGERTAFAQGASGNEAAAEALFNEARTLIAAGRVEDGCKKLEASHALDPGTGTLLHLADCQEKIGRTASAWARFREAASRASRDGRADWETIAKTRAAELEPKLAKLRIDAPAGVVIKRDGVEIPGAALGSPLPIDPGQHTLTASAPGKKTWTSQVTTAAASTVVVTVPPLELDPDAGGSGGAAGGGGSAPDASSGGALRTLGWVAGGVGIVGLGIGTVTGLSAISLNGKSKDVCPSSGVCADEGARSDNDSARSAATVSTVAFVAGGVLLAGGVALVVFAPSSSAPSRSSAASRSSALRVSPGAVWLEGSW